MRRQRPRQQTSTVHSPGRALAGRGGGPARKNPLPPSNCQGRSTRSIRLLSSPCSILYFTPSDFKVSSHLMLNIMGEFAALVSKCPKRGVKENIKNISRGDKGLVLFHCIFIYIQCLTHVFESMTMECTDVTRRNIGIFSRYSPLFDTFFPNR